MKLYSKFEHCDSGKIWSALSALHLRYMYFDTSCFRNSTGIILKFTVFKHWNSLTCCRMCYAVFIVKHETRWRDFDSIQYMNGFMQNKRHSIADAALGLRPLYIKPSIWLSPTHLIEAMDVDDALKRVEGFGIFRWAMFFIIGENFYHWPLLLTWFNFNPSMDM